MLEDTRLGRSIENIMVHDHLCLIYENQKEQFDAVIPFIKIGLGRGEKCIYIADDNTAGQVLNAMRADGIDVESALHKGALVIANKKETYLKKDFFDPDEMIEFLKVATDSAKKDGFPALRVTGEMTWVLGKDPGSMRLMEYESKLNLFFPENDCLAICQYNKNRFDPEIMKSVINTHPLIIAGGFVCKNFYYIPPEEFLEKEKGSLEVERLLYNLIDREKAEKKLNLAQKVLDRQYAEKSEIFNAIGNLTLLLDPQHNILAANRAAVTGLGKPEEELRGKKCYEFLHGTSQPPKSCPMEKMLRSNSMETSEMVVETLNGIYLVSCTPLFDEKGNLEKVIHITTDITERKRSEEALEESQSRFKSIYQQSPLAIELYDSKGLLIDANPKCLETFGVGDIHKIIGFRLFDDPNISDELKMKIGSGEVVTFESEFDFETVKNKRLYETSRSGRIYIECTISPWKIAGAMSGYLVHVTDITQRKQAEEALSLSEAKLKKAQHYAHMGSWTWNIKTGEVEWSDEMFHLFGTDKETFSGSLPEIIARAIHPEDRARVEHSNRSVIMKKKPIPLEYRVIWPDKSVHFVWAEAGELLLDESGNPCLLSGIVQDITERKKVEEELKKYREHLEELVKERTMELNQKNEELEKFNRLFVGRELRMIELKKKIEELEKKSESPEKTKAG